MAIARGRTVGEMIASHHERDRRERQYASDKVFFATPIGAAFRAFEDAVGDAWRQDTELSFSGRYDESPSAKLAWEFADKARAVLETHIKILFASASQK